MATFLTVLFWHLIFLRYFNWTFPFSHCLRIYFQELNGLLVHVPACLPIWSWQMFEDQHKAERLILRSIWSVLKPIHQFSSLSYLFNPLRIIVFYSFVFIYHCVLVWYIRCQFLVLYYNRNLSVNCPLNTNKNIVLFFIFFL